MLEQFFKYLDDMLSPRYFIYLVLLLSVVILSIFKRKKLQTRYSLLAILVGIVLASECTTRIFSYVFLNSMPVYHILAPVLCLLYWLIFRVLNKRTITDVGYMVTIILCISNSLLNESLSTFPTISIMGLSLMVVLSSLLDLKRMLDYPIETKLSWTADFWFNLGSLFFYSFTFFAFGFMNIGMVASPLWVFQIIFFANLVLYLMYGWAIYLNAQQAKNASGHHKH